MDSISKSEFSPKDLIPLTKLTTIMSSQPQTDFNGPIAGEPAKKKAQTSQPFATSKHKKQTHGKPTISRKKKALTVLQTVLIALALCLSTYSYVTLDSLSENAIDGKDADEMLVRTEGRDADSMCTEGGAEILIGNDLNNNAYLDEDEVTSSTKVCHGKEGLSGPQGAPGNTEITAQNLIDIKHLTSGQGGCVNGGITIHSGIDNNSNGDLDAAERATSVEVCDGLLGSNGNDGAAGNDGATGTDGQQGADGENGAPALVEQHQPPASVCPSGIVLRFGVDDGIGQGEARDGILHDDEVHSSLNICSTPLLFGPITDFATGIADGVSPNCDALAWNSEQQHILMAGVNGVDGCELWISDGLDGSAVLLSNIHPSGDSLPGKELGMHSVMTAHGEHIFFDADDGVNGRQLWVSDGTLSGTNLITSNGATIPVSSASTMVHWGRGVLLNSAADVLMWSDGTYAVPAFEHPDFSSQQSGQLYSQSAGMTSLGGEMLHSNQTHAWFSAKSGGDIEPHLLTLDGVITSWNINPSGSSLPNAPSIIDGTLIAVAEAQNGRQLLRLYEDGNYQWLTSLQHEGTGNPSQHTAEHLGIHLVEDRLVFDALTSGVDPRLWSHNLTSGVTQILSSNIVAPGDWAGGIVHNQKVWFDCVAPGVAHEICSSDGTESGTAVVTDLRPGMASSNILAFAVLEQHLFFIGSGKIDGTETGSCLWHFDDVELSLVYDPWIGSGNNSATGTYGGLTITEHHLLFASHDGSRGHEVHAWSHGQTTGEWLIW